MTHRAAGRTGQSRAKAESDANMKIYMTLSGGDFKTMVQTQRN